MLAFIQAGVVHEWTSLGLGCQFLADPEQTHHRCLFYALSPVELYLSSPRKFVVELLVAVAASRYYSPAH